MGLSRLLSDVLLQHAMELEGLPVGEPDAAVERLFGSELVDAKPLLRLDDAAWQATAQHDIERILCVMIAYTDILNASTNWSL